MSTSKERRAMPLQRKRGATSRPQTVNLQWATQCHHFIVAVTTTFIRAPVIICPISTSSSKLNIGWGALASNVHGGTIRRQAHMILLRQLQSVIIKAKTQCERSRTYVRYPWKEQDPKDEGLLDQEASEARKASSYFFASFFTSFLFCSAYTRDENEWTG